MLDQRERDIDWWMRMGICWIWLIHKDSMPLRTSSESQEENQSIKMLQRTCLRLWSKTACSGKRLAKSWTCLYNYQTDHKESKPEGIDFELRNIQLIRVSLEIPSRDKDYQLIRSQNSQIHCHNSIYDTNNNKFRTQWGTFPSETREWVQTNFWTS